MKLTLSICIGLVSGLLSGSFGIGGAVLSTPAIRLLLRAPANIAIGTTLPPIIPTALVGLWAYVRAGKVDVRLAVTAAAAGATFAVLGAQATEWISNDLLLLATSVLILALAAQMLRSGSHAHKPPSLPSTVWVYLATGAVSGFVAGLLGVGGGIILIPVFASILRLPIKTAVGTSLAVVAAQAIPATIRHAMLGNIDWVIAGGLAIGVIPGARIGSKLAVGASEAALRRVVGAGMAVLAAIFAATQIRALSR